MSSRGALIVVEGIDRSGKTTQCKKLVDALESLGHKVEAMKFPDRATEIGKMIDGYLQSKKKLENHAVHLLFSANRWEKAVEMRENLEKGVNLVVDRYAYSGVTYTSVKQGFSLEWCKQSDRGLPKPDVVLFLNLSPSEAERRPDYGLEKYEDVEIQKRVFANFMDLKSKDWKVIEASQTLENVHEEMLRCACSVIDNIDQNKLIENLWMDEVTEKEDD